jgi:hypothetical protein
LQTLPRYLITTETTQNEIKKLYINGKKTIVHWFHFLKDSLCSKNHGANWVLFHTAQQKK